MSMKLYPANGYLMPVSDFEELLKKELRFEVYKEFTEHIDEWGFEEACSIANRVFEELKLPKVSWILNFSDEDELDEGLEAYTPYFLFDEDDLYVKKESKELKLLKQTFETAPKLYSYAQFG